jgi:hypothetical protein
MKGVVVNLKLPIRPNLGYLKNQAKDILKGHRRKESIYCDNLRVLHRFRDLSEKDILASKLSLNEVQFALALNYGFASWDALKKFVLSQKGESIMAEIKKENGKVWIENIPILQWGKSGENTFAAALASALSVTEHPYTYAQLMGYSGLAFRLRWYRRTDTPDWCPSSPVGEFSEEIQTIQDATGWKFFQEFRMGQEHPTMEDLTDEMTASIDRGFPVLGYARGNLDVCVMHGYQKKEGDLKLIWDSFWWDDPAPLAPDEVGPWLLILRDFADPMGEKERFLNGLQTRNWRRKDMEGYGHGIDGKQCKYLYGDDAFQTWIDDIRNADNFTLEQRKKLFFVSWWVFDSLWDARRQASDFLNDNSRLLGEEAEPSINRAAEYYRNAAGLMNDALQSKVLFLGPWTGKKFEDWTPEIRKGEADLLDRIWALDKKAVKEIDSALKTYETETVNQ